MSINIKSKYSPSIIVSPEDLLQDIASTYNTDMKNAFTFIFSNIHQNSLTEIEEFTSKSKERELKHKEDQIAIFHNTFNKLKTHVENGVEYHLSASINLGPFYDAYFGVDPKILACHYTRDQVEKLGYSCSIGTYTDKNNIDIDEDIYFYFNSK